MQETISKIDLLLGKQLENKMATAKESQTSAQQSLPSTSDGQGQMISQFAGPKLPKFKLPTFDGDSSRWLEFWDPFEAAIHKNPNFAAIDKFNYLRASLEGNAASAIAGFVLSAANYQAAVVVLQERFANPQAIIANHMEKLLKLPSVLNARDTKQLRNVYDALEANFRSLKTLGIKAEQYGLLLVPVMLNKLPQELRLVISRKFERDLWDFDLFIQVFREELEARERCVSIGVSSSEQLVAAPWRPPKPPNLPTAAALLSSGNNKLTCTFCKGTHSSTSCSIVTDVSARKKVLKGEGRCYLCLKKIILFASALQSLMIKCFHCGAFSHHASVCEKSEERETQETTQVPNKNATSLYLDAKSEILLQTACAEVSGPHTDGTPVTTRIILDLGSQKSYITNKLRNRLNLQKIESENLLVKTFGSASEQFKVCDVVQVCVKGLDDVSMYILHVMLCLPFVLLFSTNQ